ncbi:MAG: 2-oxoglutarate dehydrogenase E1 component, partial [Planctomycetota bacterium]
PEYTTGGSIHVVVNNQVAFTTDPKFSRSSPYCTDLAKAVGAPVFHVNADDPEAVVAACELAADWRSKFKSDVVLDLVCYRRHGHNEIDEPSFTQPQMYAQIKNHPSTLQLYKNRLLEEGTLTQAEVDQMEAAVLKVLNEEFDISSDYEAEKKDWLSSNWDGLMAPTEQSKVLNTGVASDTLKTIATAMTKLPEGFSVHRGIKRVYDARRKAIETGEGIDWATAEALAFGTLLLEGYKVRLSGQDSVRGTFSQRHAGITEQNTEERYFPLNHLEEGQPKIEVIDSMLSEYAVLGYEYGYSLAEPNALTLWEAQFGDFVNGAQIMIDQFISSGERKWLRMSGLVMLLPHGYEGQGPEHSSARPERFLQMSAEDNWIVANCSTPANYFHILRRQLHRSFRKPLILMTPKSLLRHKRCVSTLAEMGEGSSFHRVLWDDAQLGGSELKLVDDAKIERVVICSGKVYYDLLEKRDEMGLANTYLLRLEQYYPVPAQSLARELARFPGADIVW